MLATLRGLRAAILTADAAMDAASRLPLKRTASAAFEHLSSPAGARVRTIAGQRKQYGANESKPTNCQLAASMSGGYADGSCETVRFRCPVGIKEAQDGTIYVVDRMNHCIRIMTQDGLWMTLCGMPGKEGYSDGVWSQALFNNPWHIAFLDTSSGYDLIVSDMGNHCVRRVTPTGYVTTMAGQGGLAGYADGSTPQARFTLPCGVAVDSSGNVVVSDCGNHVIRMVKRSGEVVTLAGKCGEMGHSDGVGEVSLPLTCPLIPTTCTLSHNPAP